MSRPFLVLGVIVVGIAGLLLAVLVFDAQRSAPQSLLSALKTGPKVVRKKLPQEIKIAQNLIRGKIPALDQPVNSQSKIESIPTVEKTTPSQPVVAALEKNELRDESGPDRPAESHITMETAPAEVKAAPSQPVVEAPEKSEPRGASDLDQPADPQTSIEAAVKPLPIQAPADKEGVTRKTEKRRMHSEKWLLTQESSYYTIQLMGARKEALLFDFVARNKLLEQNEIAFYQTTYKDKPWFQLLYGVYTTKKEAQSAADYLPPKIRKSSPWIRRLSAVQKAIRNRAAQ
jgi:septal ring-binding cell division protein DamX